MTAVGDTWYRYSDYLQSLGYDYERDYSYGSEVKLRLEEYTVTKLTPKGVWLDGYKFVLAGARKQFAHPTVEEARASFLARKKRQLSIYKSKVEQVQDALKCAEEWTSTS